MKPGLLWERGQSRGACQGQPHVEGDLLAGLSQACGFKRCCFRWQVGDTRKETGWCGGTKSFLDLDVPAKPPRENLEVRIHVTTDTTPLSPNHGQVPWPQTDLSLCRYLQSPTEPLPCLPIHLSSLSVDMPT